MLQATSPRKRGEVYSSASVPQCDPSGFPAMPAAVSILPSQQLAVLNDAYRKAVSRRRLRMLVAVAACAVVLFGEDRNLRQQDR
jgi:hypothetical protein